MSEKRRGLGRGLGALIPSSAGANGAGNGAAVARPVDLFFPEGRRKADPSDAVLDSAPTEEPAAGTTAKSSSAERDTATKKSASTTASNGSVNPSAAKSTPVSATSNSNGSGTKTNASANGAGKPTASAKESPEASEDGGTEPTPVPTALPAESGGASAMDNGVDLVEVPGVRFAEISVTDIHPNRKQPRSVFDEDDMAELVHSVAK
jgi:ParB family chromosome partitioning protein